MNLGIINSMDSTQLRAADSVIRMLPETEETEELLEHVVRRLRVLEDLPAKLMIEYDTCPDNPLDPEDGSGWRLVSFSRRHCNFEDPEETGDFIRDEDGRVGPSPELQARIDAGTAFLLSYFEHGNCMWFRQGSRSDVPDMRWDGVGLAGILFCAEDWSPPDTETRETHIDRVLEEYTDWCNGTVFGYRLLNDDEEELDSCWGLIGWDYLKEHLQGEHPELWNGNELVPFVELDGDAANML